MASRSKSSRGKEKKRVVQTIEERMEVRRKLRDLDQRVDRDMERIVDPKKEVLQERIDELADMTDKAQNAREQKIDTTVMRKLAQGGNEAARRLAKSMHSLDAGNFILQLQAKYPVAGGGVSLADLGRACTCMFLGPPTLAFIHGPLNVEPKVRKQAQRRRRVQEEAEPEITPETVGRGEEMEAMNARRAGELELCLKQLMETSTPKILKSGLEVKALSLFGTIVDPWSFSQTIENLFYLSFLIKEGRVTVAIDKDDDPIITVRSPDFLRTDGPAADGDVGKSVRQLCLDMDMQQWRDIKKLYRLARPLLPHRFSTDSSAPDGFAFHIDAKGKRARKPKGGTVRGRDDGEGSSAGAEAGAGGSGSGGSSGGSSGSKRRRKGAHSEDEH